MQRNKIDKISKNVNSFDKTVENFDSFDKSTIAKDTHSQFVKLDNTFKSTVTKVNSNDSPVNRLRNAYTYWQSINANDYILSIIRDGYIIPFYTEPESCSLRNNKTAFDNAEFVGSEITKLISRGCISQVPELPKVVNPLTQGSRKGDLQLIAIKIANVCKLNNIVLLPQWVPRDENVKADQISKSVDCDDWGIDQEVYSVLDNLWGPHTVDRFASDYNTKCLVFNSKHWCPNTSGINAFDQDWKSEINWIVPPPSLVSKCIQKMKQEKSIGTLIVPYWRSAPFWPILNVGIEGSQKFASFVGDSRVLSSSVVMRGRGKNGLFGKTDTNFTLLALKIRF
ncbi:Hypothetical predicted protein [Mytilus galloprovincialis]|uniref:Uncharacterized protein n=1 Tax=Mytilus galloprovincialis TaxID=29158 RepID=A0A8B6D6N2_MYTGA|nr:Hypothetical predicted protein [Mytilus galloprovincialis]